MKKKIIWGIIIVLVVGIIAWFDLPYIIPSNNVISKQNKDYTYLQIQINNFGNLDLEDDYTTNDETEIARIIEKLDSLKVRKTKEFAWSEYDISFLANYSIGERTSNTEWVFSISIGQENGDNILTIHPGSTYKSKSFKILDKDFNIEEFIKDLKGEEI